ncbi:guanosine-3',5'-bis(diphosphate) 3'-pyrophosphohydrolase [Breznakia sp. PF5-3]|uniref:RelA/SpoT family protein n=1 Tax=unclassified Breznakia TaxID=2623764 RepID=UPI0024061231|nr:MULTISPECIES: bifunctional (p)ppGpp synthetase/guanosine-3',5'-bis(diphosphate) 3'-pyrophosphohydrolase [unclassified Breznakia]MDL2276460.1 bifunctional (p)ppGpp synthetase/guanosine-3',5'-bis(diphosphate) 3'-pyrophosphohydrolase [Breznakia sp. OttesenSCG-928-G09]MDF9823899.1 guanosine-3',5'-bis(diphosphate) 3'-pyrophosphohydrolase [Breznakia sp. PM6-1]MDF9834698.1 guanosine-3',5'-bis(diphosphate) 3'-pyrophosphohydrolase [Breznakia sp. PF5-3]MDF9836867.1 guanosine-3',5'-bis(diphosphate) 3'-
MSETTIQFSDVLNEAKIYIKKEESIQLLKDAFEFADKMHKGQYRKSGEPYIIHVLHVGKILADLRTGPKTISAGLLHDVIEDCEVCEDEFKERFGAEVFTLVEAVTKIGHLKFNDEEEYLASNHRKIFIAMANDVRVILIKLADRLHNMRTLQYMKKEKQKKIAAETLDVYAPIAHRLGISEIKNELEDLSFHYLNPEKYYEIAKLVEDRKSERDTQVQTMISDFSKILDEHKLQYRMFGRSKHLYSIYKKMINKNKRFEEILDLLAIRIVTNSEVACYEILGYIHAKYTPIPGRFKDYIAMPKMNMYQSLHTTIVGGEGNIFEVQIRTEQMDEIAERGVAAHWRYKENNYVKEQQQKEIEEQLHWFKDFAIMSEDVDEDAKSFMNLISKDIFEANVYVMSPKGKVIALPSGSTPLDFAYRIHTEVGHQTIGATVNGVLVPLNTPLKTGDVVNIKTNKASTPSEDWLKIVKSNHARNKIRSYFQRIKQAEKEDGAEKGKSMLEADLIRRGFDAKEYMTTKHIETLAGQLKMHTMLDLYYAIYCKAVSLQSVIEKLTHQKTATTALKDIDIKAHTKKDTHIHSASKYGVRVPGIDSIVISLSPCCSPIPGDEIVGYITKGQGVKVHRKECPNVQEVKERLINVEWEDDLAYRDYEVNLVIHSTDRNYLLSDIVTVSSQCKVGLQHVDSKVNEDGLHATTKLTVLVHNAEHLKTLMTNLRKVISVNEVERVIL